MTLLPDLVALSRVIATAHRAAVRAGRDDVAEQLFEAGARVLLATIAAMRAEVAERAA